jgi:ribosomal-protein-alanine N-acetyltransferase
MNDLDILETDRLLLSGWRADQIDDLLRLHTDPLVTRYSSTGGAWTREEAEAALASWIDLFASRRLGKLRVRRKSDGVMVGRAGYGIFAPTGEPELGYALYPEHWGNGYAFEAASGLRDWIFRETDVGHFIGLADVNNRPSLRILTGIGMTKTRVELFGEAQHAYQFHIYKRPGG